MSNNKVYKTVEITGTSSDSIESAIKNAVSIFAQKPKHISWFTVDEIRGKPTENNGTDWQVIVKISFALDKQ